ncbi:MAG: YjbH domain-containing protein [Gemmobacter sp.]
MNVSAKLGSRAICGAAIAALALGAAGLALAETTGSLNLYGATGLIDMPSGEAQPDGQLSISTGVFGPVSRTTLSFQVTPRLSASFRFLGVRDWNTLFCPPDCNGTNAFDTYYDRSFDLRYQVLQEGRYRPAVTIGLQDFAGTGLLSGEYIVATKNVAPGVKVTAGLGWGRLGSYGDIGSPFGDRPPIDIGFGGNFNTDQWFRGPAAPFGGIEWQVNDRLALKAEYSSDAYTEEADLRGAFERKSPFNFGVEYQAAEGLRLGAYSMYGTEIGLVAHLTLNPSRFPGGGPSEGAPLPVRVRGAAGWSTGTVTDGGSAARASAELASLLKEDGIRVEGFSADASVAELRIRNTSVPAGPQAIGRAARAMTRVLPPSVEIFRIVPVVNGMALSAVTVRRSDLEALEFATDGADAIRSVAQISSIGPRQANPLRDPTLYPAFSWSIAPYNRVRFFDQNDPLKLDVGLRGTARWELLPGLTLQGAVTQKIAGNLDDRPPLPPRAGLQPVRSAIYFYDRDGETALETLALHWNGKLGNDLYGRVSVGYLERMFGGVSTEVLWKPVNSRLALGAEVNYVGQRSPSQDLGFDLPAEMYETDAGPQTGPDSYRVATGHVSAYYQLDNGFHVQLDVGRYLAGDVGATLSIDREFANGWRIGAFATKTNVSAEEFGSGSFDKGIRVEIPFAWVLGKPTRRTSTTVIRPFGRDGGARLEVEGRLYEQVRDYHTPQLDRQWGRFWK